MARVLPQAYSFEAITPGYDLPGRLIGVQAAGSSATQQPEKHHASLGAIDDLVRLDVEVIPCLGPLPAQRDQPFMPAIDVGASGVNVAAAG